MLPSDSLSVMTLPSLFYKYVTAERALACLPEVGDGALRATQPAALNDPFECHLLLKFDERDPARGDATLARVLTKLHETVRVTPDEVARAREEYGSMYMRQLFAQQVSRRFGIISFATDPLHPLMWSHYTVDGSGFVIGYRTPDIEELAVDSERLREVTYVAGQVPLVGSIVPFVPQGNIYRLLCCKSSHWEYEREFRLIVDLDGTIGTGKCDRHGHPINVLRIPNSAVRKVYYTERTPPSDVQTIERRLASVNNRYGVACATKLVLSERTFEYEAATQVAPISSAD